MISVPIKSNMKYDYLIVGAGFAGSVAAERLASQHNKKVLIVEKRNHIAGNAYDEYDEHGILVHRYGPHIFHTNSKVVFEYLSQFTEWRAAGDSIPVAMEKTYLKSGKGIITGAFTTACAFLALIISSSRGMKQLGFVAGAGLITILLTTLLFLPILLVFRERRIDRKWEKKGGREKRKVGENFYIYFFCKILHFFLLGLEQKRSLEYEL